MDFSKCGLSFDTEVTFHINLEKHGYKTLAAEKKY